jgi:dCMP deaminase
MTDHDTATKAPTAEGRIGWDEYFLKIAMLVSERATCPRMHCGAVFVRNKRILTTGYNGSPPGFPHCDDEGCLVVENHCQRTIHAELNAVIQAAQHGVSLHGATLYATNMACTTCAKMVIGAGIERVVVFTHFHDTLASQFFSQAKIPVELVEMPKREIDYDLDSFSSAKKSEKSQ